MTPPSNDPPRERRKDHALRAIYLRVDTLEKLVSDQSVQLTGLEKESAMFKWLIGIILSLLVASLAGMMTAIGRTHDITTASEARSAEASAGLARKIEKQADEVSDIKVWAKALYLVNVERQPREAAKQEANKEKEK